eukprot:GHVT01086856.1.p1 GENE.GHVT01086856.1~~GHVT01086856.1.p1  ORF type:complete len:492 (-),score=68.68 GHVT01086856.1:403-1878(-)
MLVPSDFPLSGAAGLEHPDIPLGWLLLLSSCLWLCLLTIGTIVVHSQDVVARQSEENLQHQAVIAKRLSAPLAAVCTSAVSSPAPLGSSGYGCNATLAEKSSAIHFTKEESFSWCCFRLLQAFTRRCQSFASSCLPPVRILREVSQFLSTVHAIAVVMLGVLIWCSHAVPFEFGLPSDPWPVSVLSLSAGYFIVDLLVMLACGDHLFVLHHLAALAALAGPLLSATSAYENCAGLALGEVPTVVLNLRHYLRHTEGHTHTLVMWRRALEAGKPQLQLQDGHARTQAETARVKPATQCTPGTNADTPQKTQRGERPNCQTTQPLRNSQHYRVFLHRPAPGLLAGVPPLRRLRQRFAAARASPPQPCGDCLAGSGASGPLALSPALEPLEEQKPCPCGARGRWLVRVSSSPFGIASAIFAASFLLFRGVFCPTLMVGVLASSRTTVISKVMVGTLQILSFGWCLQVVKAFRLVAHGHTHRLRANEHLGGDAQN